MCAQSTSRLDVETEHQRLLAAAPKFTHSIYRRRDLRMRRPPVDRLIWKGGRDPVQVPLQLRRQFRRGLFSDLFVETGNTVPAGVGVSLKRRREPVGKEGTS